MLTDLLTKKATKDSLLRKKILTWKLNQNFLSLIGYLYWRNRFALLTKISSKALVIVEIYLINHFFNFFTASSFGLVLFVFYYLRELQKGLIQAGKKELLEASIKNKLSDSRLALKKITYISVTYGTLTASTFLAAGIYLQATLPLLAFVGLWVLIFPLQLLSGNLWTVVYGFQRLKRNFYVIIGFRLLPILCLLLLGKTIGAYSYLLGFLVARVGEYLYLSVIAWLTLQKLELTQTAKKNKNTVGFLQKHAAQALFPLPFALYNIILALIIFVRDQTEWLSHFFIIYFLNLTIYLILRGPQSLNMDFFLALRNLDLTEAKKWLICSLQIKNFMLLGVFAILAVLLLITPDLYWNFPEFLKYAPFLLLLLTARSFFMTKQMLIQSGFIENTFLKQNITFFSLLTIAQVLLLITFRANLNLIYLIEGATLFCFSLMLSIAPNLPQSALYKFKKNYLWKKYRFLDTDQLQQKIYKNTHKFIILQLDSEFDNKQKKDLILKSLAKNLNSQIIVPIYAGFYLLVLLKEENHLELGKKLSLNYPGIIRNVIQLKPDEDALTNLSCIYNGLRKTSGQNKKTRALAHNLGSLLNDSEILKKCLSLSNTTSAESLMIQAAEILKERGVETLNYRIVGEKKRAQNDLNHLIYVDRKQRHSELIRYLLPFPTKPYLEIVRQGKTIITIDYSSKSSEEVQQLTKIIWGINLGQMIRSCR